MRGWRGQVRSQDGRGQGGLGTAGRRRVWGGVRRSNRGVVVQEGSAGDASHAPPQQLPSPRAAPTAAQVVHGPHSRPVRQNPVVLLELPGVLAMA